MANARALIGRVIEANQELVAAMTKIREMKAQVEAVPTALSTPEDWASTYPDITAEEITAAIVGWEQLIFAYDSGDPTQKSKIYGIL